MAHLPTIGVTVHLAEVESPQGHRETRYELSTSYARAVRAAGGIPLLIPTDPEPSFEAASSLEPVDGLLLSGGGSLPAAYFEENPEPSLRQTNPLRYDLEVELVRRALAASMPLMGICRGHQTIVEALGGELKRDIRNEPGLLAHYQERTPSHPTHAIRIERGSRLQRVLGSRAEVNSFHRQAATRVPDGWRATAWAEDGLIEAVEADDGFGLGCQFHPEWLGEEQPGFSLLFQEFIAAARQYGGLAAVGTAGD